jgi:hypothetical protein
VALITDHNAFKLHWMKRRRYTQGRRAKPNLLAKFENLVPGHTYTFYLIACPGKSPGVVQGLLSYAKPKYGQGAMRGPSVVQRSPWSIMQYVAQLPDDASIVNCVVFDISCDFDKACMKRVHDMQYERLEGAHYHRQHCMSDAGSSLFEHSINDGDEGRSEYGSEDEETATTTTSDSSSQDGTSLDVDEVDDGDSRDDGTGGCHMDAAGSCGAEETKEREEDLDHMCDVHSQSCCDIYEYANGGDEKFESSASDVYATVDEEDDDDSSDSDSDEDHYKSSDSHTRSNDADDDENEDANFDDDLLSDDNHSTLLSPAPNQTSMHDFKHVLNAAFDTSFSQ